jgi:thiosulfate/3-mercaptopyruvate sulfurtransferase
LLISAHDLNDLLKSRNVVVFDCRFSLASKGQGFESYGQGHIPTAYYLDLEADLSAPASAHGGRHPLPNLSEFAEKLGTAGVTVDTPVVVYDDGEGMAPRAWWLLRYVGHADVSILDGGFSAWQSHRLEVSAQVPNPRFGGAYPLRVQTGLVASLETVEAISQQSVPGTLLDSRAANRYRGEVEPIDPVAGHIPGALNAPWTEGLDADGYWKSAASQQQRFALAAKGEDLVVYCGSGVTACANLFALELAGITDAKLYPGSWSDWCSYPNHKIVKSSDGVASDGVLK